MRKIKYPFLLIIFFPFQFLPIGLLSQTWLEVNKIVASDRGPGDNFGNSTSISGNYAIIGAQYENEDVSGNNTITAAGSAYIYEKNITGEWVEAQKIVASDRMSNDYFGWSVSISGNYAVISATYRDDTTQLGAPMSNVGAAYIFERTHSGTWVEVQKITASDKDTGDLYGSSVAISGTTIVIGATYEDSDPAGGNILTRSGSAYIYERGMNGVWNEVQKITASDRYTGDYFGSYVAIDGITIFVNSFYQDTDASGGQNVKDAGAVYIFERDVNGVWNEVQKITAQNRTIDSYFGTSISIEGNQAVIGVPGDNDTIPGSGIVLRTGSTYVFERDGNGTWNALQRLVALDRDHTDYFGGSVAISEDQILIGAPFEDQDTLGGNTLTSSGSAYYFTRDPNGIWNQNQKVTASDRGINNLFGVRVALSGNEAIITAKHDSKDKFGGNPFNRAGSAYHFQSFNLSARINGNIFWDKNGDCVNQVSDVNLPNWIVKTNPGPFFSMTDDNGDFTLKVDSGLYQIQFVPNSYASNFFNSVVCPSTNYTVYVDSTIRDTSGFDFALDLAPCHKMTASIAGFRSRVCASSGTTVGYANLGLDTAYNAKAFVEYPSQISPYGASQPYITLPNGILEFDLGDVPPQSNGKINIRDSVTCNVNFIGLTTCVKAWVTPISKCNVNPAWCGDELAVSVNCLNPDVVMYTIRNIGTCNMIDSSEYRLFLDSNLIHLGKVKLVAGDSLKLQVITNGKTSRLEVDQTPNHPSNQYLTSTKEACGLASGFVISKGFVLPYPQSDPGDITVETDCRVILGSYDPNDKLVQPNGLTPQHYTKPGTELDYTIRFQNTGNDTAFRVAVIDTLPNELDIATLRQGVSSHPYILEVSGLGRPILTFTFDPIMLVDSMTNPVGSQGFVKFSISPYDSLPKGTRIENFADIYFDFNPPVRTPPVFNTIWDTVFVNLDSTLVTICDPPTPASAGLDIQICPQDTAYLSANLPLIGTGSWHIISGSGILVDSLNPQTKFYGLAVGTTILEWRTKFCENVSTDRLNIIINTPSQPSISGPSTFCIGDSISLVATTGFASYHWSNGDTTASIFVLVAGNYSVSVVNSTGCISIPSMSFSISTNQLPPKPIISGIDEICAGDTTILFAPSGFATYRWSNGETTETISTTTAGIFSVSVTDMNGCESPASDDFTVVVNPIPVTPVVMQVANDSLQSSIAGDTYQWFHNGVPITQNGATIQPTQSGTYTVVITTNGCVSDTSDGVAFLVTGIENGFEHSFAIYPNPNSGSFVLEVNPAPVGEVEIKFYDVQGKVVLSGKIKFEGGRANVKTGELVDGHAQRIPEGMYLLTVDGEVAGKVVVR